MSIPGLTRCDPLDGGTSFTEQSLELAYRNGSQCNGYVRPPFTEPGALWLKAGLLERAGGASQRNFRQIKGLIPPR
jgi:hypothetical protein